MANTRFYIVVQIKIPTSNPGVLTPVISTAEEYYIGQSKSNIDLALFSRIDARGNYYKNFDDAVAQKQKMEKFSFNYISFVIREQIVKEIWVDVV